MLKRNKANYFLFLFIDNSYPASRKTRFNVHKFGSTITKNDFGSTITNEGIRRLTLLGWDVNLGDDITIAEKSGRGSVYFFVNFNNSPTQLLQIVLQMAVMLKLLKEGASHVE